MQRLEQRPVECLMPGVPDMHSHRTLLEMGYVLKQGTFWWPEMFRTVAGVPQYRHRHFMDRNRYLEKHHV